MMHYVYILQSISAPDRFYTGLCAEVHARFERYLESGSGRAFARKWLR